MAAAYPLDPPELLPESDGLTQEEDDNTFEKAMSPNQKRKLKRKRKSSSLIENLTTVYPNSSKSDNPDAPFQTPMKQATNTNPQQTNLQILLVPIEKTKNFRNTSPLVIAKSIQTASGTEPAYVKQYPNSILVTCRHVKQFRQLQQIQKIGNIDVKITEKEKGVKGVIYGVPLEISESDILKELKSQKVTAATCKRIPMVKPWYS